MSDKTGAEHQRVIINNTPSSLWGIAIDAAMAANSFDTNTVTLNYFNNEYKAVVKKTVKGCTVRVSERSQKVK